ncbi:succinylglutamate desuccinylase/aspartoacylase family protein [Natrialbaceae archaeon A-arb3/5]
MQRKPTSRRSVLSLTAGIAAANLGIAAVGGDTDEPTDSTVTRDSFSIMAGTVHETTVYTTEASADGPTAVVIGGIHGNEVAGYAAARDVAEWPIDAGTLVTIPEANAVAIERETRVGDDGTDLNRQFRTDEEPGTELARALWDVVTDYEPDIVIDLHESTGIYAGDPVDGVGQAIFHSRDDTAASMASEAADSVTRTAVDDPELAFQTGTFSGPESDPTGLLVHRAARDLNADAFLVETLSTGVDLETRVSWHSAIVEQLVAAALFPEDTHANGGAPIEDGDDSAEDEPSEDESTDDPDEPSEDESDDPGEDDPGEDESEENRDEDAEERDGTTDGSSPVAKIRTDLDGADEATVEPGTTVHLDASCSFAPDGELVAYEWCVHDDDVYDVDGETIEVTVSARGEHPVELRVVDDAGETATAEIHLTVD